MKNYLHKSTAIWLLLSEFFKNSWSRRLRLICCSTVFGIAAHVSQEHSQFRPISFKCSTKYIPFNVNKHEWMVMIYCVYFGLFYATYFYLSAHLHMASCILFSDTFILCMILAINLISTFIFHIALHYYYVLQSRTIFVLK